MRHALKVLIVDDDKAITTALSEVVKRMGMKPIVANKATDALNVVRLQAVNAAIVDALLPKLMGVDLVQEFRKTRFAENPVIMMSGVFKDKAFSQEAIRKTSALGFLCKPFANEELTELLKTALANQLTAEKYTVQALLTRKLSSDRERAKAIEHLEEMSGRDFPFVLGILMEVGSSGHLNIVNDTGDIFGVSLIDGTIAGVDSHESQATAILGLISRGFLSQEDWDEFQKISGIKFSLEKLVEEGILSPHAISEVRREQIIGDLRSICAAQALQVNFIPQEGAQAPPPHAVKLQNLLDLLGTAIDEFFPESYLTEFYAPVFSSPVRLIHFSAQVLQVWERPQFKEVKHLKSIVEQSGSLEQAIESHPELRVKTYQCLHYLVLMRAVMFDDVNRAKNLNSMLERYQKLHTQIQGRTPDKIFEYFGANMSATKNIFQNIFDEYAKSNNPDHLGKDATPELQALSRQCFELVRNAKDIMVDDEKRAALFQKNKDEATERAKKSGVLVAEALELLRKNEPAEALAKVKEAEKFFVNNRLILISVWAAIKSGESGGKQGLVEMARKLDGLVAEERKNPIYFMAVGLVKRAQGDPAAIAMFEKALQLDSEFTEARKELNGPAGPMKKEKLDIFNADISQVVSQLFRRKAE